MTALAMILGMLPMALALGEGGEQNAPLGRAVIGGLMVATMMTLFVVPAVYSIFSRNLRGKHQRDAEIEAVTLPGPAIGVSLDDGRRSEELIAYPNPGWFFFVGCIVAVVVAVVLTAGHGAGARLTSQPPDLGTRRRATARTARAGRAGFERHAAAP